MGFNKRKMEDQRSPEHIRNCIAGYRRAQRAAERSAAN
jgi:hypothetical protein